MDINTKIKEEVPFLEVDSQTERESLSQDITMELNSDDAGLDKICEVKIKTEIKQEAATSDFCTQNDIHSSSEASVTKTNENNYCNTKISDKQELCWQGPSSPEVNIVNKNSANDGIPSAESIRLCREEAPRGNFVLLSDDNLGSNATLNMRSVAPECETARNDKTRETDEPEISSVEIHSERHNDMEMDSASSCLKQNNFIQDNNAQVHELERKNYYCEPLSVDDYICCEYKCLLCDKTFTLESDLKRHNLHHRSKKLHKCDICGKDFAHFSHLKVHKLFHEGKKAHKCEVCGKGFTTLSNLNAHKPIHDGQKPHKCDVCGKGFTRFSSLKSHKSKHEGERPYNCDACGKFFADLSSLEIHKLVHEDKMPYKCSTCGKRFSAVSGLKRHALIHEDIKPHRCVLCGKGFTTFSNLALHMSMHEDKRQHKCDICGKGFNQMSNMKKHRLTHEGKSPHKRDVC